jgi:hypothetical protein
MHDRILAIANSGELSEQTANELRGIAGEVAAFATLTVEACETAIATIHEWHGDVAWDIYAEHSPEMKKLHATLATAKQLHEE